MSIFKRSSSDTQTATVPAPSTPPGVVPPAAAPIYSTRPPEPAPQGEGLVAEKVRKAKEAQQSAQEKIRVAVRRATGTGSPPTASCVTPRAFLRPPMAPRTSSSEACAQAGLLNLAWMWQEAGAPIRAINAYVELLERYPDTPAAASAVEDLVKLSEKLAGEGQFHTALKIYDHLEQLL